MYDRVGFVGKSAKTSGYEPRIIENAIPSLDTYFAKSSELLRIDLNANPIRDRFKPRFSRDKWDFSFFFLSRLPKNFPSKTREYLKRNTNFN